ncbi:MAG: phosphatidate cytidylyltransferase [Planctomycetaceae bacterium]|nr:phosphatidate cytidylyltransferase [Planctomycetaceae bacterium]
MNDSRTIALLSGVFLVLLAATFVVSALRKRRGLGIDAAVLDTFRSRIHGWWLLFGMLVGAFLFGQIMTVLLFGFISFWALREYITLTPTRPADHRTLFWVFFLCMPLQFLLVGVSPAWFASLFAIPPYFVFSIFIPAYAFLIIPAGIATSGDSKHFLERIAKIQVGLLICVYSLSFAPALLSMHFTDPETTETGVAAMEPLDGGLLDKALDKAIEPVLQAAAKNITVLDESGNDKKNKPAVPPVLGRNDQRTPEQTVTQLTTVPPDVPQADVSRNKDKTPLAHLTGRPLRLLFFFVLIVQAGDVFQYLWSHIPQRHVVAPTINSTRTWEGVWGGAGTTALFAAALWGVTPFPEWWQAAMAGFLVSLMGFAGNLTMSAIKRDRGVEDYGTLIEGHSGVLDRIDSLCFAAPVFYHFVWLCLHTVWGAI